MPWGQVVVGPPGCGKTTYCAGMAELMRGLGRRVVVVNLDPANHALPYEAGVDVAELIQLDEVMTSLRLGPNGGLVFCMEYLEKNADWLKTALEKARDAAIASSDAADRSNVSGVAADGSTVSGGAADGSNAASRDVYYLFDFPGQVELYTHHGSVSRLLDTLTTGWDFRLTAVHLVDSHYCTEPSKFISVLCTSLSTMLQLSLPHVNVLSKIDLIEKFGSLPFNIDYFCEVLDLSFLVDQLKEDPFNKKYARLNRALCSVVEDYSLVSFFPLNISDKESALSILRQADKASGYVFGDLEERNLGRLLSSAVGADFEDAKTGRVREKYTRTEEEDGVVRELMES